MAADRARESQWRGRRDWRLRLAVGLAAVVAGAGLAMPGRGDSDGYGGGGEPRAARTGPAARPGSVVASMRDGRLVLLSAEDGRVLRVLADDPQMPLGDAGVTVTPDGQTAYFSSFRESRIGRTCNSAVLESIGVDGQGRKRVARGGRPAVSPDGRQLTYVQGYGGSCSQEVVVREPHARGERKWKVSKGESVASLSWASDSRHLLVVSDDDEAGAGPLKNRVLDTDAPGSLSKAHRIPLSRGPEVFTLVLGELGRGNIAAVARDRATPQSSEPVALGTEAGPIAHDRLVAIDPDTGEEARELYEFPSGTWGDPSFLPRPAYDDRRFASDRSGRHLLWVATSHPRVDVLYRFSLRDPQPTELANGIADAAWVPTSDRSS